MGGATPAAAMNNLPRLRASVLNACSVPSAPSDPRKWREAESRPPSASKEEFSPRIGGAGTEGTERTGQTVTRRHGDTSHPQMAGATPASAMEQPSASPCLRVKSLFRVLRPLRSQERAKGRKQITISFEGRNIYQGSALPDVTGRLGRLSKQTLLFIPCWAGV